MNLITKKRFLIFLVMCLCAFGPSANAGYSCERTWKEISHDYNLKKIYRPLVNLCGSKFRRALKRIISTNERHSYTSAKKYMFTKLDNEGGVICSVYSNRCVSSYGVPSYNKMNCEHSWPQSLGAVGLAKADLHHLYPVMSDMNSRRGNRPFCEVVRISRDFEESTIGSSEYNTRCFEPPDNHKGDLARSMFYFSIRYNYSINQEQESFFKAWNEEDRVSEKERIRNQGIYKYQKNRNPFVDCPMFAKLISDF